MDIAITTQDLNNLLSEIILPWIFTHGIKIIFIFLAAVLLKTLALRFIDRIIRRAVPGSFFVTKDAEIKRENTLIGLFKGLLNVVIWVVAGLMIMGELAINIGPILAGAGIVGVALGFGAQYLVRDLINGFFIVFENQYRVGDVVCFGDTCGAVESINLRTTILRDLDGVVHHIPNGEIKITSNMSKDFSRINLNVGVSYETKLEEAIRVINQVGRDLAKDPEWKDRITQAPQFLRVNELGDSAVVVKILGETKPLEQWSVTGELRRRIKVAFEDAGIEIPFPQQVVRQIASPKINSNE